MYVSFNFYSRSLWGHFRVQFYGKLSKTPWVKLVYVQTMHSVTRRLLRPQNGCKFKCKVFWASDYHEMIVVNIYIYLTFSESLMHIGFIGDKIKEILKTLSITFLAWTWRSVTKVAKIIPVFFKHIPIFTWTHLLTFTQPTMEFKKEWVTLYHVSLIINQFTMGRARHKTALEKEANRETDRFFVCFNLTLPFEQGTSQF